MRFRKGPETTAPRDVGRRCRRCELMRAVERYGLINLYLIAAHRMDCLTPAAPTHVTMLGEHESAMDAGTETHLRTERLDVSGGTLRRRTGTRSAGVRNAPGQTEKCAWVCGWGRRWPEVSEEQVLVSFHAVHRSTPFADEAS